LPKKRGAFFLSPLDTGYVEKSGVYSQIAEPSKRSPIVSYYDTSLLDLIKRDLAQQWAGILKNDNEISRAQHTSVYDPPPMELYEETPFASIEFAKNEGYEEPAQQEGTGPLEPHASQRYYADTPESEPMGPEDPFHRQPSSVSFDGPDAYIEDEYFGSLLEEMIEEEAQEEQMMDPSQTSGEPAELISPEEQMLLLLLEMENMGG
jgi:hypothetical protein